MASTLFFKVKFWGQIFDIEKVIPALRYKMHFSKYIKLQAKQCWNHINIFPNKKIMVIYNFDVGLEDANFGGP